MIASAMPAGDACSPRTTSPWATLSGMLRHIQEPPPNLFRSRRPWRGILSKDWVPTNNAQRVVAFVSGMIYVMGAVAAIGSTFRFKAELTADLHSEGAAAVMSFFLVCVVLAGAAIVILLGVRLLKSAFRRSANLPRI